MSKDESGCDCQEPRHRVAAVPSPTGSSASPSLAATGPPPREATPRLRAIPRLIQPRRRAARRSPPPRLVEIHPSADFGLILEFGPRFQVVPPFFNTPPLVSKGPYWAGGSTVFFLDSAGQLLPL